MHAPPLAVKLTHTPTVMLMPAISATPASSRPALADYAGPTEPGFPSFTAAEPATYEQYRQESLEAAKTWVTRLLAAFPHLADLRMSELYDCACNALAWEIHREPNPYEAALVSKALQLVVCRPMAVLEG